MDIECDDVGGEMVPEEECYYYQHLTQLAAFVDMFGIDQINTDFKRLNISVHVSKIC